MNEMKIDWQSYCPFPSFRVNQLETLEAAEVALRGCEVLLLEGETGLGKSLIATILAEHYGSAWIITATKLLQKQYANDNPSYPMLQGKGTYDCKNEDYADDKFKCNEAPCNDGGEESEDIANHCIEEGICSYWANYFAAIKGPVSILNFDNFALHGGFPRRKLLVVDECHKFISFLHDFASKELCETALKKLVPQIDIGHLFEGACDIHAVVNFLRSRVIPELKFELEKIESHGLNVKTIPAHTKLKTLKLEYEYLCQQVADGEIWVSRPNAKERTIVLTPLDVSATAKQLFSKADRVILMSATILDADLFAEILGLDHSKTKFISVPSSFAPENHAIYPLFVGRMSKNEIDQTLPIMTKAINEILQLHDTEKGIIHSHSYPITKFLKQNLSRHSRLLFQNSREGRETIFNGHTKSPFPTVLITPGMTEGVDLKDDLGRFSILTKVPYPYLGDPLVGALMERYPGWYEWKTAQNIVQALGRCIRSAKDHAVSYLLDSCFEDFLWQHEHLMPPHVFQSMRKFNAPSQSRRLTQLAHG